MLTPAPRVCRNRVTRAIQPECNPYAEDPYRPPTPTASPSDVRKASGFPSHSLSFDCGEAEPRRYFLKCIVTERQSLSAHQAAEPLFFCETQDEVPVLRTSPIVSKDL